MSTPLKSDSLEFRLLKSTKKSIFNLLSYNGIVTLVQKFNHGMTANVATATSDEHIPLAHSTNKISLLVDLPLTEKVSKVDFLHFLRDREMW